MISPLAGDLPASAAPVIAGSTWFSDGTNNQTGVSGAVVRAYAVGAIANVPYQLVSAAPMDATTRACDSDVKPINQVIIMSGPSGLLGRTTGVLDRPVGDWDVCFREPGGRTSTSPIRFRVGPGPSIVSVQGRQVVVRTRNADGTLSVAAPFVMRGIGYSPASAGTDTSPADPANADVRRQEFDRWYRTDVPMIDAMGANTVRLFIDPGITGAQGVAGLRFLDALHRRGIFAVMTVDNAINDTERLRQVVTAYRNHPAILMWSLGSEWNINRYFGVASSVDDAAARTQVAAGLIKSLDPNHPVVSSYGEISTPDTPLAKTQQYVNQLSSVDVWSLNVYRGSSFGDLFTQWASISSKPMFLGEFGTDAFRVTTNSVDEPMQANWDVALWNDIYRNLSAKDPTKVAVGGAVFEWNDEWWKVVPPGSQQTSGFSSGGHPDGFANEEYFGLVRIDRTARQAVSALRTAFDPAYVPPAPTVTLAAASRGALAQEWTGQYGSASFYRDGALLWQRYGGGGGGRGFNVAVVDRTTGQVLEPIRNFDTFGEIDAIPQLTTFLSDQPSGAVILLAVADEAGLNVADSCARLTGGGRDALTQALESLGSTQIRNYCFRYSWSMIAVKGQGARGEQLSSNTEARAETTISFG